MRLYITGNSPLTRYPLQIKAFKTDIIPHREEVQENNHKDSPNYPNGK